MEEQERSQPTPETPPARPSVMRLVVVIGALAAIVALLVVVRRVDPVSAEETVTPEGAARRVLVSHARLAPADVQLALPGSTQAVDESLVIARASGYVARLTVDLGDHVTAGQVLAELRAPETMDELRAAEARVAQATDTARWARESSQRTTELSGRGITTRQEQDDATLAVATAEATLHASEADAARLRSMRRYQSVVAPFEGVVTERLVDVGALVSAGDASGLFRIASLDRIEVVVDVPQIYAALVSVGQAIEVERPDAPGVVVNGTITRVAGSLTDTTRSMRVEAELPGAQGLLGGMFVNVRLSVHRPSPPVVILARALSVSGTGTRTWIVQDGVVHPRDVTIARDLGREVELATGLVGDEVVVLSPPDGLAEGDPVEGVERAAPAAR